MMANIFRSRRDFMSWNEYAEIIDKIDDFCWRQKVRRESIANI